MKKKILALCVVISLAAVAIIGGTLAYFTDTAKETNIIAVGDVSAKLYESKYHRGATGNSYLKMTGQPEPLTNEDIKKDYETYHKEYLPSTTLMPFDLKSDHRVQSMFEECTVAKNAYLENTSKTNDCFVRVRYLVPEEMAEYLDIFYTDTQFITANSDIATADARSLNNDDKSEPIITSINSNGANFKAQCADNFVERDGKRYYVAEFIYAERLTPGEFTLYSPISKVTMVPTVTDKTLINDNKVEGSQFNILVEADIIQADGFYNAIEAFNAFAPEA